MIAARLFGSSPRPFSSHFSIATFFTPGSDGPRSSREGELGRPRELDGAGPARGGPADDAEDDPTADPNDVDLEMEARKGPRKDAFLKLKQARKDYDDYLDANPSMEDKIDKEYCDAVALLFWIKKDSSLGELGKGAPAQIGRAHL